MSLGEDLPPQEKYRIAANHYRIMNDIAKAIESYENLVKASPADVMIRFDLGSLYEASGALDQARDQFAKVVELDPKFVLGLLALGRVEIRRDNPQASLDYLDRAQSLATQLKNDEARAEHPSGDRHRLHAAEPAGRSADALPGVAGDQTRLGNKRGMAASYVQIGEVQKTLG